MANGQMVVSSQKNGGGWKFQLDLCECQDLWAIPLSNLLTAACTSVIYKRSKGKYPGMNVIAGSSSRMMSAQVNELWE